MFEKRPSFLHTLPTPVPRLLLPRPCLSPVEVVFLSRLLFPFCSVIFKQYFSDSPCGCVFRNARILLSSSSYVFRFDIFYLLFMYTHIYIRMQTEAYTPSQIYQLFGRTFSKFADETAYFYLTTYSHLPPSLPFSLFAGSAFSAVLNIAIFSHERIFFHRQFLSCLHTCTTLPFFPFCIPYFTFLSYRIIHLLSHPLLSSTLFLDRWNYRSSNAAGGSFIQKWYINKVEHRESRYLRWEDHIKSRALRFLIHFLIWRREWEKNYYFVFQIPRVCAFNFNEW